MQPQVNDYFCGVACLQYACKYLTGQNYSQYEIADLMGITKWGSDDFQAILAAKKLGLNAFLVEREVEQYLNDKNVVMIGWFYPGEDEDDCEHYSILLEMNADTVVINDQLEQVPVQTTMKREDFMYWWKKSGDHKMTAIILEKA